MKLAERVLPPLLVVGAFAGAVVALRPAPPEKLQHTICLDLPLTVYDHVRGDLEACFAEWAERDARDVRMTAWVIIEPDGTTARVVRKAPSPLLDGCVEAALARIGESDGVHLELELDLGWIANSLQLSHTEHLRVPVPGLWADAKALLARMGDQLDDNRGSATRARLAELKREKAAIQRKLDELRRRAHR